MLSFAYHQDQSTNASAPEGIDCPRSNSDDSSIRISRRTRDDARYNTVPVSIYSAKCGYFSTLLCSLSVLRTVSPTIATPNPSTRVWVIISGRAFLAFSRSGTHVLDLTIVIIKKDACSAHHTPHLLSVVESYCIIWMVCWDKRNDLCCSAWFLTHLSTNNYGKVPNAL